MSLVAYASSDESDSEDASVTEETKVENASLTDRTITSNQPNLDQISDSDSDHDVESNAQDIGSLLKGLPEPKELDLNRVEEGVQKQEDELEDVVKPKLSQMKDAPKPPPKKAKVQITIPALPSDSDEEDGQVKKKPRISSGSKSGLLTSLLPAPVHAATKETNRILLPYSLSKKTQESKKITPAPTSGGRGSAAVSVPHPGGVKFQGVSGYGSDSDSDDGGSDSTNFFSLGSSSNEEGPIGPVLPEPLQRSNKLSLPPPKSTLIGGNNQFHEPESATNTTSTDSVGTLGDNNDSLTSDEIMISDKNHQNLSSHTEDPQNKMLTFESTASNQDAPLSFKSGNWNTMSVPYHGLHQGGYGSQIDTPNTTDVPGPQMDYGQYEMGPQYGQGEIQNFENDEEFLKIQGKKQRGKEEINIVDVNADDFISTVEVQKMLSEEKQEYASHRKKDGPTSQQKRKHQITYLAHQAKEQELELKNQWSQNRMTKRQTQAKYGF